MDEYRRRQLDALLGNPTRRDIERWRRVKEENREDEDD